MIVPPNVPAIVKYCVTLLNKLAPKTGIKVNTKLINKFLVVDHYTAF